MRSLLIQQLSTALKHPMANRLWVITLGMAHFVLIVGIAITMTSTRAWALGTVAGTSIVDQGNTLQVNYLNPSGSSATPVSGTGVLTANVQAVYGLTVISSPPNTNQSIAKTATAQYPSTVQNASNTTVTLTFSENSFTNYGNFGSAWTRNFTYNGGSLGIDALQSTTYNVTPASNAQNGSQGVSVVGFSISGSNFGSYNGFNNVTYGGFGALAGTVTTSVVAPELRVQAKTLKLIQAPTANGYRSGNTNYEHDPVPGSVIEYSIQIINEGGIASTTTDVLEKIPANAVFHSISSDSDVTENGGLLNALNDVDYDTIPGDGIVDLNLHDPDYPGRADVVNIRFRISSIGIGQTKTLKYRVTVRE